MSTHDVTGGSGQIRLMVIDGSALHRHALVSGLANHSQLRLIGTAINASTALAKLTTYHPDVIAIDTATQTLDGLELALKIRATAPEIGLLLMAADPQSASAQAATPQLSSCTTLVRPPQAFASPDEITQFAKMALQASRRTGTGHVAPASAPPPTRVATPQRRRSSPNAPAEIVVIGCSTGGPNALTRVLPDLPQNFPLPIVVVQHMPEGFTKSLAESLDRVCKLKVSEAQHGQILHTGEILIAPGGKHLGIDQTSGGYVTRLSLEPAEHSCRPAVDYTMRSIAAAAGQHVIAVIMTGMGEDGLAGCRLLHQQGAHIIAQHKDSCTVYGMPRGPIEQGLADTVAPLEQIASSIKNRTRNIR